MTKVDQKPDGAPKVRLSSPACYMDEFPEYFGLPEKDQASAEEKSPPAPREDVKE
ncbi:MAG: hypothetical protein JJ879_04065 [Sneathiella sp.]|nr:hypothetical protein [Sneathiella sp.]